MSINYSSIEPTAAPGATPTPPPASTNTQSGGINYQSIEPADTSVGGQVKSAVGKIGDALQNVPAKGKNPFQKAVNFAGEGPWENLVKSVGTGQGFGFKAFNYVEGAMQRFIAGVTVGGDNPTPNEAWWDRVHYGYTAAFRGNQQLDEHLEQNYAQTLFGPAWDSIKGDKYKMAAAMFAMQMATDPVNWFGGMAIRKGGGYVMDKAVKAMDALAEDKEVGWMGKRLLGEVADHIRNMTYKPGSWVKDEHGRDVYKANYFVGLNHGYAKHNFWLRKDTGAYHQGVGIDTNHDAIMHRIQAAGHQAIDKVEAQVKASTSPKDWPREAVMLTRALSVHFGAPKVAEAALKAAEKDKMNLQDSAAWDRFKEISDTYGLKNSSNYGFRDEYIPNWVRMGDFVQRNEDRQMLLQYQRARNFGWRKIFDPKAEKEKVYGPGPAYEHRKKVTAYSKETGEKVEYDPDSKEQITETSFPKDPLKALRTRVDLEARAVANHYARREYAKLTGFGVKVGGRIYHSGKDFKARQERAINPDALKSIRRDPNELSNFQQLFHYNPKDHLFKNVQDFADKAGQNSFVRAMSSAMTKGITSNAIPHDINMMRLVWLAGGPKAMFELLKLGAAGKLDKAEIAEMAKHGSSPFTFEHLPNQKESYWDFTGGMSHWFGMKQWNDINHGALRNLDVAIKLALWRQFKKQWPDKSLWEIGHLVAEATGGYSASPAYAKVLRAVGGMFPLWHGRSSLMTFLKSFAYKPWRANALFQADNQVNEEDLANLKQYQADFHLFGGSAYNSTKLLDSAAQIATGQMPRDVTGASMIGLIPSTGVRYAMGERGPNLPGTIAGTAIEQGAMSMGLPGQAIESTINTFNDKRPLGARILQDYMGIYPEYQNMFWELVAQFRAVPGTSEHQAVRQAQKMTSIYSVWR